MSSEVLRIGQQVGIHKLVKGYADLTIYGEISAIRRHWNGNPDLLEIQLGGLNEWIGLDNVQLSNLEEVPNEQDCS